MKSFDQYLKDQNLMEAPLPPMPGGIGPGGPGGGIGSPAGLPPGGPGGGLSPLGGGSPLPPLGGGGGGLPPLPGGPGGLGGPQPPGQQQQQPIKMQTPDVWNVLEELLGMKEKKEKPKGKQEK